MRTRPLGSSARPRRREKAPSDDFLCGFWCYRGLAVLGLEGGLGNPMRALVISS